MSASIRIAVCDLNGQARGKRLPMSAMDKVMAGGVAMPLSVSNVDIFGADIDGSPLVFETGDGDGQLAPTGRDPIPMPWLPSETWLVPMMMRAEGAPFAGDPRNALAREMAFLAEDGLEGMAGTELEFTLCDDKSGEPRQPRNPRTGRPL
ncbi:MAG: glutamine synthetase, partial [Pseudomonadota bacterium]